MKVAQIIDNIDINSGGPSKSITSLSNSISLLNLKIELFSRKSPQPIIQSGTNHNFDINFVSDQLLKSKLNTIEFDIFHGHGIWQMPVHYMAQIARRRNIPYLISPRGMLEPWALNARKWKKKLALAMYQRNDLINAFCIHATAQMEAENIRKLGFKNPIAVIPNGIDVNEFTIKTGMSKKRKKTLLFLSRIHPKKGIENLIEAWRQTDKALLQNWQVEIAGTGDENYITSLQRLIFTNGLSDKIKIIGPQFGSAKLEVYHRADLFVLPTYSENFGIVVAEALACGIPVITTKGTPWEELNTLNAGSWIDIGVQPLVKALQEILHLNEEQLIQMGKNGRKLVEEKYSIEAVASEMLILYKWILKQGIKPSFVRLD